MSDEADKIGINVDAVRAEVAKFDQFEAGLAALEKAHPTDVVCDVSTPAGMDAAVVSRRAWREPRLAVEKARKAAKAPVLALGRKIDEFAGSLESRLRIGEDHYDGPIKAEEQRREQERERLRAIEAERVAEIRRRIVGAFSPPVHPKGPGFRWTVAELTVERERAENYPIDDSFGDLKIEAEEARTRVLEWIGVVIETAAANELEQAEARRLREQQAAERKKEAEERAVQDAAQAAEVARLRAEVLRLTPPAPPAPPPQVAQPVELAADPRADVPMPIRVLSFAGQMFDCLRQWQAADLSSDAVELQNARNERDLIISTLKGTTA